MPWAGWGAGPSGAGATGGPTRLFLLLALFGAVVAAVALFSERRTLAGLIVAAAAVYFALRLFAGLGRRNS